MAVLILACAVSFALLPLLICVNMAEKKGKSKGLWAFLSLVCGWFAVVVLAAAVSER